MLKVEVIAVKISDFARVNGISVRALRYYDEIGLLKPTRVDSQTGYRDYDEAAASRLQAIRFYQTAGFSLRETADLLDMPDDARLAAMSHQRQRLVRQRDRLDRLINLLTPGEHDQPRQEASLTSLLSAFARAYHARTELPVFVDDMARALMTDAEYARISQYILGGRDFLMPELPSLPEDEALRRLVNSQFVPATAARSRFCEDSLRTARRAGTEQAVLLGAGLDTLAWRMPGLPVYEADHPVTQADKLRRIRQAGLTMPPNCTCVPVDFTLDDLALRLMEAGFDPARKSFFSWLGVSYYLPVPVIGEVLSAVASLSVKGTALLFDYADEDFLSSPVRRVQNMISMASAAGEPVQTCFTAAQLITLLEHHGFQVYELLTWQDLQTRYFAGRSDGLSAFEHIGCVLAVFNG